MWTAILKFFLGIDEGEDRRNRKRLKTDRHSATFANISEKGAQTPREIAEDRIQTAWTSGATELDLSGLGLSAVPASLRALTQLEKLDISNNKITKLPESLGFLINARVRTTVRNTQLQSGNLPFLILSKGRFDKSEPTILNGEDLDIPTYVRRGIAFLGQPSIKLELPKLRILDASYNYLTSLPTTLSQIPRLQNISVRGNQLTSLPESLRQLRNLVDLNIEDNPGLNIPEVLLKSHDPKRIFEHYFDLGVGDRSLNEAKLILVGRGGVGKTSLVNRLVHDRYNVSEAQTDGISITQWPVDIGNDTIQLNIWDFGGQEIMHATHQFFLTKRSLYLLVLDARDGEQDANVEYWLQLIESFGGGSPVLVVINKVSEYAFDLNRRGLRAKFPAVRNFIQTDCRTGFGIVELRQAVAQETDWLEHLRDPFPASWFAVKEELSNLSNKSHNFITFSKYQELCAKNGVVEDSNQEKLVGLLHDLGIVVNFRDDPRLSETHVLNPEWVTNGIYKILNADHLASNQGELRLDNLVNILDHEVYPRSMHLYILDLLRKFELCYEFYESAGQYLIPELLGKEEPDLLKFISEDALGFDYSYNILPEGLLTRFIVRSRALNKSLPRWRTGVVLCWDENHAVVRADLQDRRVSIVITGPLTGRRQLLAVIRADMEHIHQSIAKLRVSEQVPVPWCPELTVPYKKLLIMEANGKKEFDEEYRGQLVNLNVSNLLNGVDDPSMKDRTLKSAVNAGKSIRIAFSYSHKDEELRDQLETHLKLMHRQGLISTWHDRKIFAGKQWAGVIDENFKQADLILLLISADFLASDYCYEIEMQTALQREERREARVIPVILRECKWNKAPFGKLQALPRDAEPVANWSNRDKAWTNVADGIEKIVQELRLGYLK